MNFLFKYIRSLFISPDFGLRPETMGVRIDRLGEGGDCEGVDCRLIGGPGDGDLVFQAIFGPALLILYPVEAPVSIHSYTDSGLVNDQGENVFLWDGEVNQ